MATLQKIVPFLWFDNQAKEAATYYCSIFPDSGIISHSPLITEFKLCGQSFSALNGGPKFKFTEAVSFVINCIDQKEVDFYWNTLTSDGGKESMCGWLNDKFGLSWQVVPQQFVYMMSQGSETQRKKMMDKLLTMQKLIVSDLEAAFNS